MSSNTDKVATLFARHYRHWLDIPTIIRGGGGLGGWRTEVSRCRQQFGMRFETRITRSPSGAVVTSEYRCVDLGTLAAADRQASA